MTDYILEYLNYSFHSLKVLHIFNSNFLIQEWSKKKIQGAILIVKPLLSLS